MHLSEQPYWLRLLYWEPRWLRPARSMVASEAFFLADDGRRSPHAELLADLRGFADPAATVRGSVKAHPSCAFPARRAWLSQQLHLPADAWPHVACPELDDWVQQHRYASSTLVFSSFYADNPASLFGHTFLRLNRPKRGTHATSGLNDDAVSFSAQIAPGTGYLRYAWDGLVGGFDGRFSMAPYYFKIQEYNNLESRDLWEYPLRLNQAEISRMLLSLWELGANTVDYQYFDQNCSYLILALLDTARDDLDLAAQLRFWVTPSDALKVAVHHLAAPDPPGYWASARSRYRDRLSRLSAAGLEALSRAISEPAASVAATLHDLEPAERRRVLDAGLEYIDFKEQLGGSKQATKYAQLRRQLLSQRRLIVEKPDAFAAVPADQSPAAGHSTIRIGAGLMRQAEALRTRSGIHLEWTPALHDLLGQSSGYGDGMAIEFMALAADYLPATRTLQLDDLKLLSVFSLAPPLALVPQRAWNFNLGAQNLGECPARLGDCWRRELSYGEGRAVDVGSARLYAMALGVAGSSTRRGQELYAGLGPKVGLVWSVAPSVRVVAQASLVRRLARSPVSFWQGQAAAAYAINLNTDLRFAVGGASVLGEATEWRSSLILGWYF